jgi:hypothetical protein
MDEKTALQVSGLINQFRKGKIKRRHIRNRLFKIRLGFENLPEDGLKEFIETQLDNNKGISWNTFSHNWDVAANDPFKVIQRQEWATYGGQYDENGICYPSAFTGQEE